MKMGWLVVLGMILFGSTAWGSDYDVYWVGGGGEYWDVEANWQQGAESLGWGIPGMVTEGQEWNSNKGFALIESSQAVLDGLHSPNGRIERVYIGGSAGSSLVNDGGDNTCYKFFTASEAGWIGEYWQTAGTWTVDSYTYFGQGANSEFVMTLQGGVFETNDYVYAPSAEVSGSDTTINVAGGTFRLNSNLYAGNRAGCETVINLSAGLIEHNGANFCLSNRGDAYLNISGGLFQTNALDRLRVGWAEGGEGHIKISGGSFDVNKELALHRGSLHVYGSQISQIDIAKLLCVDGAGEILEFTLDSGGVTPMVITDDIVGNTGADLDDCTLKINVTADFAVSAGCRVVVLSASSIITDGRLSIVNTDDVYRFGYEIEYDSGTGRYNLVLVLQDDEFTWVGGQGYWDDGANWSDYVVPGSQSNAFVRDGLVMIPLLGTCRANTLSIDDATLAMDYGTLRLTSDLYAGCEDGSQVVIDQTGGNLEVGGLVSLGYDGSESIDASYNISGGSLAIGGDVMVGGFNNNGDYVQSGGAAVIGGNLCCGCDGGFGVVEVSGGSLEVDGYTVIRDGEFRVLGSTIDSVRLNRLDMENEAYSIFVAGIDAGGVTTVDIVGDYVKLDGARIRVEPLAGYAAKYGDTFDIIRIPATKTVRLVDTEVESATGQKYTAALVYSNGYKYIRLTVASHSLPMTVFRYRSYIEDRPASVSETVSTISHSAGTSDIITYDRGEGFNDFYCTRFDGSDYLRAVGPVGTFDHVLPVEQLGAGYSDSFTVEVWFRPDGTSGTQTLLSNLDDGGFALKITDGQLRGECVFSGSDGGGAVSHDIAGGLVEADVWYHAAFVVKKGQADDYELRLYLDERLAVRERVTGYAGVVQSEACLMMGSRPVDDGPAGEYFTGYIHAGLISNYAKSEVYLTSQCLRDGSSYLGMTDCHDYLDAHKGFDIRLDENFARYSDLGRYMGKRYLFPLIDDGYVPQAIAFDGVDKIYVSCFWYDVDLSKYEYPSVLAELTTEGRLLRVMQLFKPDGSDFVWHSGGIAYYDGRIYIVGSNDICRFTLDANSSNIINPQTLANIRHDANPLVADAIYYNLNLSPNLSMGGASMACDSDGTPLLWTTEFSADSYRYLIAHEIAPNGSISTTQAPRYVFSLPVFSVQGISCYEISDTQIRVYFSQSTGDNPSYVYDVLYNKSSIAIGEVSTIFTCPGGIQALTMIGDGLWSVAESGSKVFQKRVEDYWREMFPFVFLISFGNCDVNNDGATDILDLSELVYQWLGEPLVPSADIYPEAGDGVVDLYDFVEFGNCWLM